MLRKAVLAAALLGLGASFASGAAGARDWNDSRHERSDRRDDRRDDRRGNDSRRYDQGRGYGYGYGSTPRYYAPPRYYVPPRYYAPPRYGYERPRDGWREPYGRGYRYWRNNHYYYVEPGRPAVELSFILPLR